MKNNKSLLTIIIVSVLVFGGLIFSVYKLTNKKESVFYANGYVSSADSESSIKTYFNEDTSYKKGYNNQIIFKDVNGTKKEISKYSFVFYNNGSIGLLTNAVLLDLNGLTSSFIPYYNILSNYIIEYTAGKYVIHSSEKDIILDNFISRINDQKYLIAGNNIKLKLSSSEEYIKASYFELNFIDGENVKIDGKDISLETISSESYILVNDNIKIDLSTRKISVNGDTKLDLSEIILDNDENIDIKYDDIFNEDENKTENISNGTGNGTGAGAGNGTGNTDTKNSDTKNQTKDNKKEDTKNDTKEYQLETVTEYKNLPYVEILSSYVGSQKINIEFKVNDDHGLIQNKQVKVRLLKLNDENATPQDVTYTTNGNTINYIADSLQSSASYLVTITTSYIRDGVIFSDYILFQRTYNTSDIGIELERDFLSSDSIGYLITSDETSTYASAQLNIYDAGGYYVNGQTFNNNHSDQVIEIKGLCSNMKYTAKIENVVYGYVTMTGELTSRTDKTLKSNPFKDSLYEKQPVVTVNKADGNYKIDIGSVNDIDESIKSVKYEIYKNIVNTDTNETSSELVKTIKKDSINSFNISFDEEVTTHNTYFVKTYVTLNDNEKTIEYELLDSNIFGSDAKQSPTMTFTSEQVSTTSIKGKILLQDPDNSVDYSYNLTLYYTDVDGNEGETTLAFSNDYCAAGTSEKYKCADVDIKNLSPNNVYTLSLFGFIDLDDEDLPAGFNLIGAFKVNTNEAVEIKTYFNKINRLDGDISETDRIKILADLSDKLFEVELELILDLAVEKNVLTMNNMSSFQLFLYEGKSITNKTPIGSAKITEDIAKTYFNQYVLNPEQGFDRKVLDITDFGTTLEQYKNKQSTTNNQIASDYTILITNGKSGDNDVVFKEATYHFKIEDVLIDYITANAWVDIEQLPNTLDGKIGNEVIDHYTDDLEENTTIGLKLVPQYDNSNLAKNIYYKIYDVTNRDTSKDGNSTINKDDIINGNFPYVSFTYKVASEFSSNSTQPSMKIWLPDQDSKTFKVSDLFDNQKLISDFTLNNANDTSITEKTFFRRGRVYFATILVGIDDGNDGEKIIPDNQIENCGKIPNEAIVLKQAPKVKIFPYESSITTDGVNYENGTIVYKYNPSYVENNIKSDIDNAIIKNSEGTEILYTLGEYTSSDQIKNAKKHDCTKVNDDYKCAKLTDLTDNIEYSVLINADLSERANYGSAPILVGTYTYEEYKSSLDVTYNILRKDENDETTGNKYNNLFTLKLNDETNGTNLNKVSYYTVEISNSTQTLYVIDYISDYNYELNKGRSISIKGIIENTTWKDTSDANLAKTAYVNKCGDDKCIYIDYSKLYLSNTYATNFSNLIDMDLYINVKAVYDTGRIDYSQGNSTSSMGYPNQYGYTFQSRTSKESNYNYNYSYIYVHPNQFNKADIENKINNLNIQYLYEYNTTYGFVETEKDENQITFKNNIFNIELNKNYKITKNGINVNGTYNGVVAKTLGQSQINVFEGKSNSTKYEAVIPSIRQTENRTTLDGLKSKFNITGIDNVTLSNDITFEIYKNETLLKSIKIDQDILTNDYKEYIIKKEGESEINVTLGGYNDNYYIDVIKIHDETDALVEEKYYSYNYKTGIIKLNQEYAKGKTLRVYYRIIFYGLDQGTDYLLKAYATKKNDKKVYFALRTLDESVINTYDEYAYEFTTKKISDELFISNATLDQKSDKDYGNRTITLNYTISDIEGFDNIDYQLANDFGGNYTLSTTGSSYKYEKPKDCYYSTNSTCFSKSGNTYTATVKFKVIDHYDYTGNTTINDYLNNNNDFIYGTDYNITITTDKLNSSKISTTNVNGVNMAELKNPTFTVKKLSYSDKSTNSSNTNYSLKYILEVNDTDHVIVNDVISDELDYFSDGSTVNGTKKVNKDIKTNNIVEITYDKLDANTGYYYTIYYNTYRNNANLIADGNDTRKTNLNKRFLNYTVNDDDFSLGIHEFSIENRSTAYLKFGFTTNFAKPENDNSTQKVYVAGIHYKITQIEATSIVSGDDVDLIFTNETVQTIKNSTNETSLLLGSNYYQVTLDISSLNILKSTYRINYQVYYQKTGEEGKYKKDTCPKGKTWLDSANECYYLSSELYTNTSTYTGEGAK